MRYIFVLVLCCLATGSVAQTGTYDQLFREGTLDILADDQVLLYHQDVEVQADPERGGLETGIVTMSVVDDDIVDLRLTKDGRYKTYGRYPKSVGNPLMMVVAETVSRDMAALAGGSPFYIRNRVKNAMVSMAEVTTGTAEWGGAEVATQTVVLRPFLQDPNRDRMRGWQDLQFRVTTSDDVPGWYYSIEAIAEHEGQTVYRRSLTLEETAE